MQRQMANHEPGLDDFLAPLQVGPDTLHQLSRRFSTTFRHLAYHSTEQFLPTPITSLPSGTEKGKFLAIDLGGTNLRVGFVELLGQSSRARQHDSTGPSFGGAASRDLSSEKPQLRRTLEKTWPIGEHLKMDQADDLFSWIGHCIAEVVSDGVRADLQADVDEHVALKQLDMGITFSFPMKYGVPFQLAITSLLISFNAPQYSIPSALLNVSLTLPRQESLHEATPMPMGKGFTIPPNLNLGKMLLAGYERHAATPMTFDGESNVSSALSKTFRLPRLRIAAITNDTVATIASKAYTVKSRPNSRVVMGLIVGTGTNATIPMKLKDISPSKVSQISLPPSTDPEEAQVIVNTEWAINGSAAPLRELGLLSKWDLILDKASEAPGFQPFEYMTAGRYLGELVRLIVLDLLTSKLGIEQEKLPVGLRRRNDLTTTFLATSVARAGTIQYLVKELQTHLPSPEQSDWSWTDQTAEILRVVARTLQIRSAGLVAAATIGLLGCTGEVRLRPGVAENLDINGLHSEQATLDQGVEELVVASTGGVMTHYPAYQETCQNFIEAILQHEGGRAAQQRVVLRQALDGGIIGAGVLAGTV